MKEKIKKFIQRIKVFFFLYKNIEVFLHTEFLVELHKMIYKVAEERSPQIAKIAVAHTKLKDDKYELVSIWAGAGIGAKPIKRVEELLDENNKLKARLYEVLGESEMPRREGH